MINLARYYSGKKIGATDRFLLMKVVAKFLNDLAKPHRIIFFGSILGDRFDDSSDIDVIAVFLNLATADKARRTIYGAAQPQLNHSLQVVCVDLATYREKSQQGGIYYIAANEGIELQL